MNTEYGVQYQPHTHSTKQWRSKFSPSFVTHSHENERAIVIWIISVLIRNKQKLNWQFTGWSRYTMNSTNRAHGGDIETIQMRAALAIDFLTGRYHLSQSRSARPIALLCILRKLATSWAWFYNKRWTGTDDGIMIIFLHANRTDSVDRTEAEVSTWFGSPADCKFSSTLKPQLLHVCLWALQVCRSRIR